MLVNQLNAAIGRRTQNQKMKRPLQNINRQKECQSAQRDYAKTDFEFPPRINCSRQQNDGQQYQGNQQMNGYSVHKLLSNIDEKITSGSIANVWYKPPARNALPHHPR